jgi:hypothetical protein
VSAVRNSSSAPDLRAFNVGQWPPRPVPYLLTEPSLFTAFSAAVRSGTILQRNLGADVMPHPSDRFSRFSGRQFNDSHKATRDAGRRVLPTLLRHAEPYSDLRASRCKALGSDGQPGAAFMGTPGTWQDTNTFRKDKPDA